MAYDEGVAGRLRTVIGHRRAIEKKMFGGLAFMVRGNMCCGVIDNRVLLRLGNDGAGEALKLPGVLEMDFTGKTIRSMVFLGPEAFEDDDDLERWIDQAMDFVKTLPEK
jgi:TfoX/Sxy family transcriptional regulator of competence genes